MPENAEGRTLKNSQSDVKSQGERTWATHTKYKMLRAVLPQLTLVRIDVWRCVGRRIIMHSPGPPAVAKNRVSSYSSKSAMFHTASR